MILKRVFCVITGFIFGFLLLSVQKGVLIRSLTIYQSIPNNNYVTVKSCKQDILTKSADCRSRQLTKIPDDLQRDLRILNLWNNGIATVSNYSFIRYPLLNELYLTSNKLRSIQPLGFYSLQHLRKLYLNDNELVSLSNGEVFKWLPKLTHLGLSNCHLQYVPNNLFSYLPEIQQVCLDANNITSVKISSCSSKVLAYISLSNNCIHQLTPETFQVSCQIDSIYLIGNDLQTIDPSTVASLHVRYLAVSMQIRTRETWNNLFTGISRSNISEIFILGRQALVNVPEGFFAPLQNHYLRRLDLGHNHMPTLKQGTFTNLTRVTSLVLFANFIKHIEPEHFAQMKGLRSINLNNNMIISINHQKSKWTNNIQSLSLIGNELTTVDSYAFYGLENLTHLDLMINEKLFVINITAFTGLINLKEINLFGCSLQKISLFAPHLKSFSTSYCNRVVGPFGLHGEIFKDTQSLEVMEITYSLDSRSLSSIEGDLLFAGLQNLKCLYLSHNYFDSGFPSDTFRNLTSLEELFLNSSIIKYIESDVFTGLTSLRVLDLGDNEIVHLPHLTSLYNLQNLYLDDNKLDYLNDTTFIDTTILSFISISNNLFVYFNRSSFDSLNLSMLSIDISRNPLTCKCGWLVSFLKDVNLINAEQTICSSAFGPLHPLENKPLLESELSELCAPNVAVYAAIPVMILALSTLMFTVYYYRWYLKYKLFLLKLAILGYDEIQDGGGPQDFEYELNVVYADNDEIWIQDHLRQALIDKMPEYDHDDRNVIGDDNLPLGMYYLDAVLHVMERSYKLIIIVSRAAVQSNIFITKFRIAQDLVNDLQIEKIFVVFLDDIPDDEMPAVVRLYLSSRRPYLTWTDDERGREYFWDQFEKLLKVNKRANPLIPAE